MGLSALNSPPEKVSVSPAFRTGAESGQSLLYNISWGLLFVLHQMYNHWEEMLKPLQAQVVGSVLLNFLNHIALFYLMAQKSTNKG